MGHPICVQRLPVGLLVNATHSPHLAAKTLRESPHVTFFSHLRSPPHLISSFSHLSPLESLKSEEVGRYTEVWGPPWPLDVHVLEHSPGSWVGSKYAEGFYNMAKVIISPEHTRHGVSTSFSRDVHLGLHVHEAVMDRPPDTWLRLERQPCTLA